MLAQLLREHRLASAQGDAAPRRYDLVDDDRVALAASRARQSKIVSIAPNWVARARLEAGGLPDGQG
jgi:hypothetical protein